MSDETLSGHCTSDCSNNELQRKWLNEGEAVIADVQSFVKNIAISMKTEINREKCVYFNLETKESNSYCIEMSVRGFRICGHHFDLIEEQGDSVYFETIYALLDTVSEEYRRCFSDSLIDKLKKLENRE